MPGTEHGDMRLRLAHGLEQQHRGATAALAEAGAEGEALEAGVTAALFQHFTGDLLGLVLQVAAADGVVQALTADHHLRAGIARRGAALLDDGHQHAGFALLLQVGECFDPGRVAHGSVLRIARWRVQSVATGTFVLR